MRNLRSAALASASFLTFVTSAYGQEAPADDEGQSAAEIVVTGTLIRGIAPPGTNTIAVSEAQIEATGANSATQLLTTVPQFGNFNSIVTPTGEGNFSTTNRANLRGLTGTTSGGSATLMLIDGHRIVGMGLSSTVPDLDVVPPGAIERLEIIPDGGSSIYGADAVAGVINFITRKKMNGLELDARYGFGDEYHTFDANVTAGKDWGSGSIFISYNYSEHDAIFGRDRDYLRTYPAANPLAAGRALGELRCPGGNVNALGSSDIYGLPFTPNAAAKLNQINACDLTDDASLYPDEKRHTVFAGLNQQLSDALRFDLSAFYFNRKQLNSLGQFAGSNFVTSIPQAFIPVFLPASIADQVNFSPFQGANTIGSVDNVSWAFGGPNATDKTVSIEAWSVAPTFTYDFGGSWQGRLMASYGESTSEQHTEALYTSTLPLAIRNGLFNPYNPRASAGIAPLVDYETFGLSRQRLTDVKLVFDGDLFTLPGGAVKAAFGAEYMAEGFRTQRGNTRPGSQNTGSPAVIMNSLVAPFAPVTLMPALAPIPRFNLSRNTKSVFGEVVVPIFSAENATAGFRELTLSASGRFDSYSDFGDTFNPKFGLTWRPTEWLKLRGSWGTSFSAPSLADSDIADPVTGSFQAGAGFNFFLPASGLAANGFTPANGYPAPTGASNLLVMLGGTAGLQPQTATTWSAGFDLDPPFLPGFRLSVTYFSIKYKNLISQPPFTSPGLFLSTFKPQYLIVRPGNAEDLARLNEYVAAVSTFGSANPCNPLASCVYAVYDVRKRNLGRYNLAGLDFLASYNHDTSFGSIDANLSATYELTKDQSGTLTSAFVSSLDTSNRFRLRASLGAWIGNFRAQATWNHTQGFNLSSAVLATPDFPAQTSIGAYNVIDLYFRYNVPGEGALKDLAFTLNVNNLLDQDPPVYRARQDFVRSANGYLNGSTVGRLIQVGVIKKF